MRRLLLGIYLPLILILPSVLFVVALTLIRNPQIPYYAIGKARLHSDVVNAKVLLDGEELPALVYSLKDYRKPGEGRRFMVFSPGWNGIYPMTILDIDNRNVGYSPASANTHSMFFSRYLIQTDAAYDVIWESRTKSWGGEPKMAVHGNRVTFYVDKLLGEKKVEIIFDNKL